MPSSSLFALIRMVAAVAMLSAAQLAAASTTDDLPRAEVTIVDRTLKPAVLDAQLLAARRFYAFWDTGDPRFAELALSPAFTDRTLPPGRPQGTSGPPFASKAFRAIVPDLRVHVRQLLVVGDRVIAHLQLTGHFSGTFAGRAGDGRLIDFIATDILRIEDDRVIDNWHIEDNATFFRQLGVGP